MDLEYTIIDEQYEAGIIINLGLKQPPRPSDCLSRSNPGTIPAYIALRGILYKRGWANLKGEIEAPGLILNRRVQFDGDLGSWVFEVTLRLDPTKIQ
ncbi:MAG: hypothetical protein KKH88_02970 [Nanoarchaeota archaeon]|nr:hypothetical protein [Nanoarchaeota archaeon]MBU1445278.1 hypothetical protein [Nanoarchaeota archaeon]MBU2406790.1 hypothetical protein [Nanoarchaeota archaeon]MBU2420474.1 hypothetical protein [Nanoarchaeota archaeon]MBU2475100.1 hypothetical protein [Nanoarchaeota archaeon]